MSLIIKFVIFLLTFVAISINVNAKNEDYEFNIKNLIRQLSYMFGVTVDYLYNREINYPPIDEDVTFWAISPGQSDFIQIFTIDDDENDTINHIEMNKPIGLLIHGWIDKFHGGHLNRHRNNNNNNDFIGWMDTTARAWSNFKNHTVICVDWSRLANYEYFIAAKVNTKLVGNYIGEFIKYLQNFGVHLDNVTVTGHSLGGQIAGYVGASLNGLLGQIIGLDPAGPLFTYPRDRGIAKRLDRTDAKFVQIIYTSCHTLGIGINSGHANYFANGGVIQPGCVLAPLFNVKTDVPTVTSACSHLRAVEYFRSSCNPSNVFLGKQCKKEQKCNVAQSFITSIPIIGIKLLSPIARLLKCSSTGKSDVFGVFNKGVHGSFNLRTTKANSPFV